MNCPQCHSDNVNVQVVNETNTWLVEKHHGCLWWLFIGWWWLPLKWLAQLLLFGVFAVLYWLLKSPRYKQITQHRKVSMGVCQNCGHTWVISRR